jgi:hypothetical protein
MYRAAITTMTKEVLDASRDLSEGAIMEVFKSKIEPQIEKVRAEIRAEREKQSRRFWVGGAAIAAGVALGAWGGIPVLLKAALGLPATATGATLLGKAASSICEHGAEVRQKNDFYFLLRLVED